MTEKTLNMPLKKLSREDMHEIMNFVALQTRRDWGIVESTEEDRKKQAEELGLDWGEVKHMI